MRVSGSTACPDSCRRGASSLTCDETAVQSASDSLQAHEREISVARTHITRRRFLSKTALGGAAAFLAGPAGGARACQRPATYPAIEQARDAALAVLKPKQKDLEHGLALHASSIVFDVYGFSPNAAVDGDMLAKAITDGASDIELQDLTE